jgi:hypothetical protein
VTTTVLIIAAQIAGLPATATEAHRDVMLMAAVEETVERWCPGHRPPEPYRTLIEHLGAECYKCRELASRRLRNASTDGSVRWLFWARRHRDPEVRVRANNILRELTRCGECGGGGICRMHKPVAGGDPDGPCVNCGRWAWSHFDNPGECRACGGEGFGWTKGAFD